MKNWSKISLAAALLSLVISPTLFAQDWAGGERAQGIVVDASDSPIQGAIVTLRYDLGSKKGPKPLKSNKKGRWSVLGLKPGAWTATAEAEGYVPREVRFTVFDAGANETVKIQLREIPAEVKEAEQRNEANDLLTQGNELVGAGKFAEARETYEKVLALLPEEEHAPILAGIASSYFREENNEKGNEVLTRTLALDPDNEAALRLKIAALAAEGKEDEAKEYMARLGEEAKLDPNAELNLGVLRYNENDLEGAMAIFERVRDAHPQIAEARYYCGLVYLAQGNNDSALAEFREFMKLDPSHAKAGEVKEYLTFLEQPASE